MFSCPRLTLQFAALTGIAAMLSSAPPAVAAESTVAAAATATTAPSVINRHALRGTCLAASCDRDDSRVSRLGCSGGWCGRQFVLMVGIGY
jgi:uncharacterized low-complexity protein